MLNLVDNTVLSNFSLVQQPDLIQQALGDKVATTESVWAELQAGMGIGRLPAQDWSWLAILSLEEIEQPLYQRLTQRLNIGEASCLALAITRGYRIFTDDRDARKVAVEWRVPVSGTLGLLMHLVDLDILSVEEGDALLAQMIASGYYTPVTSLEALL